MSETSDDVLHIFCGHTGIPYNTDFSEKLIKIDLNYNYNEGQSRVFHGFS